jgi:hypothetical protein
MYKNYKIIINATITVFFFTLFKANASSELASHLFDNKDYDAAFIEFQKDAHLGFEAAQLRLAVMHIKGLKNKKNLRSYTYKLLTSDGGNTEAKDYSTQIYNSFNNVNKSNATFRNALSCILLF